MERVMRQMMYFHNDIQLNPKSVDYHGSKQLSGEPTDYVPTYDRYYMRWNHNYLPVTRIVRYNPFGAKHECDARCMNAKGKNMNCECACGGKNHGKGTFKCEEFKQTLK